MSSSPKLTFIAHIINKLIGETGSIKFLGSSIEVLKLTHRSLDYVLAPTEPPPCTDHEIIASILIVAD